VIIGMIIRLPFVTVWMILLGSGSYGMAHGRKSSRRLVARKSSSKEQCNASGSCEMCASDDLRTKEACKETGRQQELVCSRGGELDNEASSGAAETNRVFRSCKTTAADNEFAMVRFQVFCFLLGSMAFASAKKQMRLSSNLFDQRKRGQQPVTRRQTDQREDEVEMRQFEEETRRLLWNTSNRLEVI